MEDEECLPENSSLKLYLQNLGFSDLQVTKNAQQYPSNIKFELSKAKSKLPAVETIDEDVMDQIGTIISTQMLFEEDISKVEKLLSNFKVVKHGMLKNMFKDLFGVAVMFMGLCLYWVLGNYSLFIVSSFYAYTAADYLRRRHFNKIRLKKLTTILQANFMLLKKTVKFIEESRIIEANNTCANNSVEFMEGFDFYQNFKSDFQISINEVINVFVKSTQELINKIPLYDCIDNPDYYSFNDLKNNYNQIKNGSCSLSSLYEIYLLVQSEFLRRLILSLIPNIKLSNKDSFCEYNKILTETCVSLLKIKNKLNKKFKFLFLNGIHSPKDKFEFKLPLKNKTGNSYSNELIFNIHETSKTFQNLLLKCRTLEENLTNSDNIPAFVEQELTKIQSDLNNCQRNIVDSFILLKKANRVNESLDKSDEFKVQEEMLADSSENFKKIMVGHTDLDPKIEDEIFEAYFGNENSGRVDFDDWELDDRLEKRLQKENCRSVMKELKLKLVEKAKYWRRRERELLKKKGLLDETENSLEDEEKEQDSDEEIRGKSDSETPFINNLINRNLTQHHATLQSSEANDDYRGAGILDNKENDDSFSSEKVSAQTVPHPVESRSEPRNLNDNNFETYVTDSETSSALQGNSEIENEHPIQMFNSSFLNDLSQARQKIFKSSLAEEEFFCVSGEDSSEEETT